MKSWQIAKDNMTQFKIPPSPKRSTKLRKAICKPTPKQTNKAKPKEVASKEYMKFDFYFKRTCFRTMTLYFKTAFKPFFDQCRSKRKKQPVSEYIAKYTSIA